MHIAINTIPLSGGHSGRGIGIYTNELISSLQSHESSHQYSFFSAAGDIDRGADVVHYPFFDPFFLTLPWRSHKPTVVTVHDLIPIAYPKHFPRGVRGELKWRLQRNSLKRVAHMVITDSVASKRDIMHFTGITDDRIRVVPLAPRSAFQRISDKKRLSEVSKKYNLNNKFVLYVGDVNWNKNVPGIIESFRNISKKRKDLTLVLVGKAFGDTTLSEAQDILRSINDNDLKNRVSTLGFVPDEDLAGLYSLAQLLLYPSFAEGFGFPVLEAMICGCPVVTSAIPSILEIAGPSIIVNPNVVLDIQRGIIEVLLMSYEKRDLQIKKQKSWVRTYNWKNVADKTIAVYEEIIRNNSGI